MSDAITRLQRERDLALRRIDELHAYYKRERKSHARRDSSLNRDYLKASGDLEITQRHLDQVESLCETQTLMIKRLQEELGYPDQDPYVQRVHREYEQRVEDYEDRIRQLESELQEDDDKQAKEIQRWRRERNMARDEAAEAQREKITLFNEQKRCESQVQRLGSEVQRANQVMDKMRTEAVNMRSKLADLREERSNLQRQLKTTAAESKAALRQRESSIVNLRSQLDHRNQELDGLEQSALTTQEKRTRLQLLSTEMSVSAVSLRRELEESRAATAAAGVSEEAGRQQLARMMDEQLIQNQQPILTQTLFVGRRVGASMGEGRHAE